MRFVIVAILLTCSTAFGAPPVVPVEPIVGKSAEVLFFDIKGDPAKTIYAPGFDPNKCKVVRLWTDAPDVMSFMAFPKADGEYYVTFLTQGEKAYSQVILRSGNWKANPNPQPVPPDPNPQPVPPDPVPVKYDNVWVILVEDAKSVRSIETAKMLNDPYWQTLKPKHEYRHYLNTSDWAKEAGYVAEAEMSGVGYPAAIIIDSVTGKKIKSFKATSVDSIKAEVSKVTK